MANRQPFVVVPAAHGFFSLFLYEENGRKLFAKIPIVAWLIAQDSGHDAEEERVSALTSHGLTYDNAVIVQPDGLVVDHDTIWSNVAEWADRHSASPATR